MVFMKHPAARLEYSWRAGIVFDGEGNGEGTGNDPSMEGFVSDDPTVGDSVTDGIGLAIQMFTRFGMLANDDVMSSLDIKGMAEAAGFSAEDPSYIGGDLAGPAGNGTGNVNMNELISFVTDEGGDAGALLLGDNLKQRINADESNNFLARERIKRAYRGITANREYAGDDAALLGFTDGDGEFLNRLTNEEGWDRGTTAQRLLHRLNKESGSTDVHAQDFLKYAGRIVNDDAFLPFEIEDRDFGDVSDEDGARLSRDFRFAGDFLDGAFDTHLTAGDDRETYEAGAAADSRQNFGFNAEFNRALVADERFSEFTQDFGNMRLQNWLDDNDKRGDFDAFQAEYNAGPSIPGDSGGDVYNGDDTGSTGAYGDDAHGTDLSTVLETGDSQILAELLGLNINIDIPEIDFSFLDEGLSSELPEVARGTQLDREDGVNDLDEMRKRFLNRSRRATSNVNDVMTGNGLQFL